MREGEFTTLCWQNIPVGHPLRGLIVTFQREKTRTEVVFQRNHRLIEDPVEDVHESLAQFTFDQGARNC